ncbi:MAG: phosphomannomutase/phosphoglucomutase [Prevotellaceae bacterium]|jgi:phosphomannomutase|nr:phosphomannomutase/phosphoglucomutase [Prevotellaceae bacterium]
MGAFHAYDIRGIYNRDFSKEDVYKMGFFLPAILKTDRILVGRDVRVSSPEIFEALTQGITDAGCDVFDIGLSTTPMVYYGTFKYGFKGSVQITASHNPREYNGLKVSRENAAPVGYDTGLKELEELVKNGKVELAIIKGEVKELNVKDDYIAFLRRCRTDYSNLKIAADLSNGMAALIAEDVLGTDIHYLFKELDGTFPNHEANPLVRENVAALKRTVVENSYDIGLIFDGDADRVMFVDEKGQFISPDLMIAVLGHYFFEEKGQKGVVLQDIRGSKAVGEYLAKNWNAEVFTWRVGRAFAAPKLREIDGLFGGELAGHYYFKDFSYSDSGMMAALILLGIFARMKSDGVSVSQLIARIAVYKNSGEINYKIEDKTGAMKAVCDYFKSVEKPTGAMDFDGYRIEFPEWWFNIRPSNTEPCLRFIAEAKTEEMLAEKLEQVNEILKQFS